MLDIDIKKLNKMDQLAREVLVLSRNSLLVNLRFLDMALSQFILQPYVFTLATNGQYMLYDATYVLNLYMKNNEEVTRSYLHMVLHCVYRHMYVHTLVNHACWDLACDIAVESTINDLNLRGMANEKQAGQAAVIDELKREIEFLTAEKIYSYYFEKKLTDEQLMRLNELFWGDDHTIWYMSEERQDEILGNGDSDQQDEDKQNNSGDGQDGDKQNNSDDGQGDGEEDSKEQESNNANADSGGQPDNGDSKSNDQKSDGPNANGNSKSDNGNSRSNGQGNMLSSTVSIAIQEKIWKEISERMQQDVMMFSNGRYGDAGALVQNLKSVNREKYDYESFLRKFAVMGEAMKINDDEFDYIFYTYGLKLYKKVPLVEPLEYKDVKRIKEFVIAIDTSGSVIGDLVRQFVQKTYNILKSTESFFSKINLRIIQCDDKIQEDVKITSQEEFDRYFATMELHGFGGNNEIGLFRYIDGLIANKEFTNLKGMVYLTDGYGIFPDKKPNYDVAFVFINDRYEIPEVPPWVIKLVLQKDEI